MRQAKLIGHLGSVTSEEPVQTHKHNKSVENGLLDEEGENNRLWSAPAILRRGDGDW